AHDPANPWPNGLREGTKNLEESKTEHLPRVVCLGIGLPIVLSKPTDQLVGLGICNNSDDIAGEALLCLAAGQLPAHGPVRVLRPRT
ncbi:unnamed protein product, partial [Pylaiella littoralis]